MILSTWNVNSYRKRINQIESILNEVDILMLQELKSEQFDFNTNHKVQISHVSEKQFNGVAILSKIPFKLIDRNINLKNQARYIEIEINSTRIINIYAPNGNPVGSDKFEYKIQWMDELISILKDNRSKNIPTIIAGDFNIIPTDQCCHDPQSWDGDAVIDPRSRAKYYEIISIGYEEMSKLIEYPNQPNYTFWSYMNRSFDRNAGVRIDYMFACPLMIDNIKSCSVMTKYRAIESPSDHAPVLYEIEKFE